MKNENKNKVCLVLEGGAMRGIYTAGVVDVLLKEKIHVDAIIGTSAGALFGINYVSKQKGRSLRYNKKYIKMISSALIISLLELRLNLKFGIYCAAFKTLYMNL